jgi:hypothetical protein
MQGENVERSLGRKRVLKAAKPTVLLEAPRRLPGCGPTKARGNSLHVFPPFCGGQRRWRTSALVRIPDPTPTSRHVPKSVQQADIEPPLIWQPTYRRAKSAEKQTLQTLRHFWSGIKYIKPDMIPDINYLKLGYLHVKKHFAGAAS